MLEAISGGSYRSYVDQHVLQPLGMNASHSIIDDALRGSGIGRQLMARAMAFVDDKYDETYLWTFKSLDAARHLYESFGFTLTDEAEGTQWGTSVTEQRFTRRPAR